MNELTKLETVAAMAMQGLLASERPNFRHTDENDLASTAMRYAQALLAECAKAERVLPLEKPWTCSICGAETRNKHGYCDFHTGATTAK